jgi:general stress protein 26
MQDEHNDREWVLALVDRIKVAMLTTRGKDAALVSRPIETLQLDASGVLWFFTSHRSDKVRDIAADDRVHLAYVDIANQQFLSISGRAEISFDRAKISQLWTIGQRVFFPAGPDDADLVLLKVHVTRGHYWDGKESLPGKVLKFGRAVIQGHPQDLGTDRELHDIAR